MINLKKKSRRLINPTSKASFIDENTRIEIGSFIIQQRRYLSIRFKNFIFDE